MNFEGLLNKNLIERYQISAEEINSILESSKADIETAKNLLNMDVCWAFNIVYNSIVEAGLALMYSKGFRPSGDAKHVSIILFLRKALGENYKDKLNRLDQMRRRRNKTIYGMLRDVTEYEAKDSVKFATEFAEEIAKFT